MFPAVCTATALCSLMAHCSIVAPCTVGVATAPLPACRCDIAGIRERKGKKKGWKTSGAGSPDQANRSFRGVWARLFTSGRVNEALGCWYSRRRVCTRAEGGPAAAAPGRRQRPHCPPSDATGEQKMLKKSNGACQWDESMLFGLLNKSNLLKK